MQWRADAARLWRNHRIAIVLSAVSLITGIVLCLLIQREPDVHCVVWVNASEVASWALSKTNRGSDLANTHCEGGLALSVELWTAVNATPDLCDVDQSMPTLPAYLLTCLEPRLSRRAFVTLATTAVTLIAMMKDLPPDVCMLGATVFLLLFPWANGEPDGIISETEAWQGFANEGVLTVGVLFMVARAVDATGIVEIIMRALLGKPKSLFIAQLRMLCPLLIMGAFLNNTPIVAMLIPVVTTWSTRIDQPNSRFMMPLSFGSMLSGMLSMMGTSTNLVVAG